MTRQDLLKDIDDMFVLHSEGNISLEGLRSRIRLAIGAFCDDLEATVREMREILDEKLPNLREQREWRMTRE